MYENRQFIIFDVSEVLAINYTQVCETSPETLRRSADGTKTFVKWDSGSEPTFVAELTTKEGPYNHEEILSILAGEDWVHPHTMCNKKGT